MLQNIRTVQSRQYLPESFSLKDFRTYGSVGSKREEYPYSDATDFQLDVEMETGTGKTYCYTKTIFEFNRLYGWKKFIVMVPSIAIREGVYQSFQTTAGHFMEHYGEGARVFVYHSGRLHELNAFASDDCISVMIINIQAFNARNRANRRIYEQLDQFQSRKPIEIIAATRPILIMDEPQKLGGDSTVKALIRFNPLMILRYSATHKVRHNLVHRLDALDAYNRKLVKRIAVRGIQVRGLSSMSAFMCLLDIDLVRRQPTAWIELETMARSGRIRRQARQIQCGTDLHAVSGGLDAYKGYIVASINYRDGSVGFDNGEHIEIGDAHGDVTGQDLRRMQIRETIKAHLDTEEKLYPQGIKVLSLFFIDRVVKYRDYGESDGKGVYARIFEDEYSLQVEQYLADPGNGTKQYRDYLRDIDAGLTHNGYFAIDKRTRRLTDPSKSGNAIGDVDAYGLILKEKERLLSFEEDTRFIFSHSALQEGWDNPNVFVICILKNGRSRITRRQEVGRGLRLCVNQDGLRVDDDARVHDVNILTVVTGESYEGFVRGLQNEIVGDLNSRPKRASRDYFLGMMLQTAEGPIKIDKGMAKRIASYLTHYDYKDDDDYLTAKYYKHRREDTLEELSEMLKPYKDPIIKLIDSVFSDELLPEIADTRKYRRNRLNENFYKESFQRLWNAINSKAVYYVDFDSKELAALCVARINEDVRITPIKYVIAEGEQREEIKEQELRDSATFRAGSITHFRGQTHPSQVKFDLLGQIAESTALTRKTVANILNDIDRKCFQQFSQNPEQFLVRVSRVINEQRAAMVIEHLVYDPLEERYGIEIFTAGESRKDFSRATEKLNRHVYDHAITDSNVEREFVSALDRGAEIEVYAKLPSGFTIPTPVGDYNPDWAITMKEGDLRHIYFVAETKGELSSLTLRGSEVAKIECAKLFFKQVVCAIGEERVGYGVVRNYAELMDLVGGDY